MGKKYDFFEVDDIEIEQEDINSKNNREESEGQKRISNKGIEVHKFNEKNAMSYFFRKKSRRAKKYQLYDFFFNEEDLELNDKISELIDKWHDLEILKRVPRDNWYYPNIEEKETEIKNILKGDSY